METDTHTVAADQLRAFIERIERLEEEKAELSGDIREVYAEAKGQGFDTKAIRKIIAMRKIDEAERREQEAVLELYMQALGMLADTPLGRAAAERDLKDTKLTIEFPGHEPIETTSAKLAQATAILDLEAKTKPKRARRKSFKDEVAETLERTFAGTGVTVERDARI